MKPVSTKSQLAMIGTGYVVVVAFAAAALYERRLIEAAHPADVQAAGGMYAAGDMMLGIFIAFLLMVPTMFLVRLVSKFETPAGAYSKILLAIGLSAPVALGILALGEARVPHVLDAACLLRLLWSPLVLALMVFSRIVAKFQLAKRLTSYALVSEGATLSFSLAWLVLSMTAGRR